MLRTPISRVHAGPLVASLALSATASAQFSTSQPVAPPGLVPSSAPGTGGFLMGSDDCASAHTQLQPGDVVGAPFVTGTTGSAGQDEALCYAFWTTGIDADVWFDWSATQSGAVELSLCGGTFVDTKAAIWPGTPGCPLDGTALACSEDGCSLQTRVQFPGSIGTAYTIQLGTFPGATGGSGTFDITQTSAPVCGLYDDGVTESSLGLTAGGELMWMHRQECLIDVERIETAYGSPTFPGGVANGAASKVCLWQDTDCDLLPSTGTGAPLAWIQTVVVNASTDLLNVFPLNPPVFIPSGCSWVGASADHVPGEYPGPMDETAPSPAAWIVGSTLGPGTLNVNDLNANNVPPTEAAAAGLSTAFLLRASGTEAPDPGPGTPLCFGDGTGTPCPCGNAGDAGRGCANSVAGIGGAWLRLVGTASVGLGVTTVCEAYGAAGGQPGLFFQGLQATNGGAGLVLGDGLRCCGQGVVRLEVVSSNASGLAATTVSIPEVGGLQAGDVRCYQYWYRDPVGGPCGTGFNLSNGYQLVWVP